MNANPIFQSDGSPSLFGVSPEEWVTHAYQKFLGQPAPDQGSYDYWLGQMNEGLTPYELLRQFASGPEGMVNTLHQQYFGRSPDPGNWAGYLQINQDQGPDAVRTAMAASPASMDYRLGDGYREAARADVAGINNMPFVYSNFANMPGDPSASMNILYPQGAGGQLIQGLLGPLMDQFKPASQQPTVAQKQDDGRQQPDNDVYPQSYIPAFLDFSSGGLFAGGGR